jgi:hypothetical protein
MKSWQNAHILEMIRRNKMVNPRLYIASGKYSGQFCLFTGHTSGGKMSVLPDSIAERMANGQPSYAHYTMLEELDEWGKPMIVPVQDMTGREINIGSFVCYSIGEGKGSHALEIGKVTEFTKVGALKVDRIVKNGQNINDLSPYGRNTTRIVNDPMRSIKLPVDDKTVIMWMMQDFQELAKSKMY